MPGRVAVGREPSGAREVSQLRRSSGGIFKSSLPMETVVLWPEQQQAHVTAWLCSSEPQTSGKVAV